MASNFDIVIVGAGLVGTAAAKYCAVYGENFKIALIGPTEPKKENYDKEKIFGAYFDEGRITRHLDPDPIWTHVAKESIKRYRNIEYESGISFFTENGYLDLAKSEKDEMFQKCLEVALQQNIEVIVMKDTESIEQAFPYLKPAPGTVGLYEQKNSGTINPRALVKAQKLLAIRHGVTVFNDIVTKVNKRSADYQVTTTSNGTIFSNKLILCVGAFINHNDLIPAHLRIDVWPKLIVAQRIRVNPEIVERLKGMPSASVVISRDDSEAFYFLAPIKYPDGEWYIKLGLHVVAEFNEPCKSPQRMTEWYRSGETEVGDMTAKLCGIAKNFIPDLVAIRNEDIVIDTCAITETPNQRPYVDQISDNMFIFTGCNGWAAKSSDELGRLLAKLTISDIWDCPLDRDNFRCHFIK